MHLLVPSEGVFYGVYNEISSWPYIKDEENSEEDYFGPKTGQGLLEFKCKSKIQKHGLAGTVSANGHALLLSSQVPVRTDQSIASSSRLDMFGKTSKLRSYLARPSGARVASGRFANTETAISSVTFKFEIILSSDSSNLNKVSVPHPSIFF
ncbi:hypothetical protein YC2023_042451 [Brassica napus]